MSRGSSVPPEETNTTSKDSQPGSPKVEDDSRSHSSYGSNQATVHQEEDVSVEDRDPVYTWLNSVIVGLDPHHLARRNVEVDDWPYNPVVSYEEPPGDLYGWDGRDRRPHWQRCYNCKAVARLTEGCNHKKW